MKRIHPFFSALVSWVITGASVIAMTACFIGAAAVAMQIRDKNMDWGIGTVVLVLLSLTAGFWGFLSVPSGRKYFLNKFPH